jgi:hypothetical protein
VKTFDNYWRTYNAELFGNIEKLSKIRMWLKEKGFLLCSMDYILLEITCYDYKKKSKKMYLHVLL